MKLITATHKEKKYSTKYFHYAKRMPVNTTGYSVMNDKNEWCGCILYGSGANQNIGKEFGLEQSQVYELVRVALNGKQEQTSKALAMSIKQIKRDNPKLRMLVSYADSNQNHIGIIYQATNWYYIGECASECGVMVNGKLTHRRSLFSKYGTSSIEWLKNNIDSDIVNTFGKPKHKYVYLFDKSIYRLIEERIKSYPKKNKEN